jgi:hypothetical protein
LWGRDALNAWYRYLYAAGRAGSDATYTAQAHIDWLLQTTHIDQPTDGARVSGAAEIAGTATQERFQFYKLEYRPADSPADTWFSIGEPVYQPVENGPLATWEIGGLAPGVYHLRLVVVDITGNFGPYDEVTVRVVR